MRTVGRRKESMLTPGVAGDSPRAVARLGEVLAAFGTDTFIPI